MLKEKTLFRGELALPFAVLINSFGVVLMLYSAAGISAISSVPYAFSEVFPELSLGTWTYIFQGLLVLSLMIMRKKFVPSYLFSFVVGFVFGELLDVHELWIGHSAGQPAVARDVVSAELRYTERGHCSVEPLRPSDSSDRPFPAGAFRYYKGGLSENKDSVRRDLPGRDRRADFLRTGAH